MYHRILVPVENSSYDERILEHVEQLAQYCGASIVLIHVADGWAARNIQQLNLRESEEMRGDRDYIEQLAQPSERPRGSRRKRCSLAATRRPRSPRRRSARHCDLIAMSTHGHRFLADLIYGSVANAVRHMTTVPVLLLRAPGAPKPKAIAT